jgi:hypothetical protein
VRGLHRLPSDGKLRMRSAHLRSETVGANVHCQKGNNPDLQLRPLNGC